ncbi:twin-arginine translocation signal domain-containing protein [Vibrio nereis]|uniref:twin-arginine translocation signal domain-containing protein n=1 Tax=Vibrio nereis TaxID=693 RepID=UPI000B1776E4|nr:twin-arginine translocation signal domain-containing protein [Vibrio nereis]
MNKHNDTNDTATNQDLLDASRRNAIKMAGAGAVALSVGALTGGQAMASSNLELGNNWDKTFAKSDKVDHKKVTFKNRYGITLAADLYQQKKQFWQTSSTCS